MKSLRGFTLVELPVDRLDKLGTGKLRTIQPRMRRAFTLVELLVVIAIIGVLIALLLPAVQAAREAARRSQCSNNLKQIGLAILNYENTHGVIPTSSAHYPEAPESNLDGSGASWMVGILPFIEQGTVFGQLETAGKAVEGHGIVSRGNREIIASPIDIFFCPSDTTKGEVRTDVWLLNRIPFATTNYGGVMGPHNLGNSSIFGGLPDCHNFSAYKTKECSGTFWRHSHLAPVKLASFTDGTSNTTIVGEILPEFDSFKVWALGNGTFASTHAPLNWFPEPNEPWTGWPNQVSFRSRHPGGAYFLWGDGHVALMSESVDRDTYRALSTRNLEEIAVDDQ